VIRFGVLLALVVLLGAPGARAGDGKPDARDSHVIQDCIKSNPQKPEVCIRRIANPCLDRDDNKSTADMVACSACEHAVWDDILNETYRWLRDKLDAQHQVKLRGMQRAWIASRDKTCVFYRDFFQGTIASPMSAGMRQRGDRAARLVIG